jgi:hypothetical protein
VACSCGKHSLILAHIWTMCYTTVVRPGEGNLVQLQVQALLSLVTKS